MAEPSKSSDAIDPATYVERHIRLIELEREAEIEQVRRESAELPDDEREARGVLLRRLTVVDVGSAFGGRTALTLGLGGGGELPAHRFSNGDAVALRATDGEPLGGVVHRVEADSVRVILDSEDPEVPEGRLRLERLAPDTTFRRMRSALERVVRHDAVLRDVVLCRHGPRVADSARGEAMRAAREDEPVAHLDRSQLAAVDFALDPSRRLTLVHGPPGTGKTTTLVELIRRAAARGDRVLACAPSNVAVDNLAERLAAAGLRIVRVGHPARFATDAAREWSISAQVDASADRKPIRDLRRETDELRRRLERGNLRRDERRAVQQELRRTRGELRGLERAAVKCVLRGAEVVLATTIGAADPRIDEAFADLEQRPGGPKPRPFELVVVDEAGQSLEAATWIPLLRGRRAVLAGDHYQLPPTVLSEQAVRDGLARTMFERLYDWSRHLPADEDCICMLATQYRMHTSIMDWSSRHFYDGLLEADASVAGHGLGDLPGVDPAVDPHGLLAAPLVWIDTAGCGFEESAGATDEGSKANVGEAELATSHVRRLLSAGVAPADIGVISPYLAQVRDLRERLADERRAGLEVHTVDGFQGREKEALVVSLVRSNDRGQVGFLADARRLNVAITRARRHCAVFGDSATLADDPTLSSLLDHCGEIGQHRSAYEFLD